MVLTDRSIFIAEDDAVLRSVLTEIFRECGWRVRSAADGFTSLQAIAEEPPAVLLSDLEMSGMSGFELLSVVRRRFPSIRVVAMSGAFTGTAVPAGVAADGFYAKGGSVTTLLDLVAEVRGMPDRTPCPNDIPVWLPSDLAASAPNGALAVACSNCLRAIYLTGTHTGRTSQLICPHCHQQVTVFLLGEASRVLERELQDNTPLASPSSLLRTQAVQVGELS